MHMPLPVLVKEEDYSKQEIIDEFALDENKQEQYKALSGEDDLIFEELQKHNVPADYIDIVNIWKKQPNDQKSDYLQYNIQNHKLTFDPEYIKNTIKTINDAKAKIEKATNPVEITDIVNQVFNDEFDDMICVYANGFFNIYNSIDFISKNYKNQNYNNYRIIGFMNYHM